ncbi:hypothetical protein [Campylobacter ureolyticus]|uniref:hypothetical protein n=1 Tax=Campylobacter ureolyticus TaxID=827 RepID=UPI0029095232|nr:hypothetical protein [Campylobacter ureolyticus]MDU5326618.1 hypothetical protein [Campylobacter ureolyticus]
MFLNQLKDGSKQAFLDLALICAKADENLDNKEAEILEIYCDEMGIAKPAKTYKADYIVDLYKNDIEKYEQELTGIFNHFTMKELVIIYFELFAMIYADNSFDEIERDIILKLKKKILDQAIYQTLSPALRGAEEVLLPVLENSARALVSQMDMLKLIKKDI